MASSRLATQPKIGKISRPTIKLSVGKEIDNIAEFMLDNGYVFELNRIFFHPMGLVMSVQEDDETGELALAIQDHSDNPVALFDEETFEKGRTKWRKYYRTRGTKAHQLRKRRLGFVVQQRGKYWEQPDFKPVKA